MQLDFLRGVAILLVLGNHWVKTADAGIFWPIAGAWKRIGWIGDYLFVTVQSRLGTISARASDPVR